MSTGLWTNRKFVRCTCWGQLTFLGLCTNPVVDDDGRLPGDPLELALLIFPGNPVAKAKMESWLQELAKVVLIHRYTGPDGRAYIEIPRFRDHQDSRYRVPSKLPSFQSQGGNRPAQAESAGRRPDVLDLDLVSDHDQEQQQQPLAGLTVESKPGKPTKDLPDGFGAWWAVYPRKEKQGDAIKAWGDLAPSRDLQLQMVAAVQVQRTWWRWRKEDGKYVPLPATWIRGRRWVDQPPPGEGPGVGPGDGLSDAERRFRGA